jgi:hypothetical protein
MSRWLADHSPEQVIDALRDYYANQGRNLGPGSVEQDLTDWLDEASNLIGYYGEPLPGVLQRDLEAGAAPEMLQELVERLRDLAAAVESARRMAEAAA